MIAKTLASSLLPTKTGDVRISAFNVADEPVEHVALVKGDISGGELVPTYVHSECLVGDRFGSLRCDCRRLLEGALDWLGAAGRGVVVYISPHPSTLAVTNVLRAYESAAPHVSAGQRKPSVGDRSIASAILQRLGARSAVLVSSDGEAMEALTWRPERRARRRVSTKTTKKSNVSKVGSSRRGR